MQTNETKYTAQMYNDLLRRKDALEAENKRLREALRPFAEASKCICPNVVDSVGLHVSSGAIRMLNIGDLRRAAESMKGGAE